MYEHFQVERSVAVAMAAVAASPRREIAGEELVQGECTLFIRQKRVATATVTLQADPA
jgi:hypothetical protein